MCLDNNTFVQGIVMNTVEKLRALRYLWDQANTIMDEGPGNEGWQSDELLAGLVALDEVINRLESGELAL